MFRTERKFSILIFQMRIDSAIAIMKSLKLMYQCPLHNAKICAVVVVVAVLYNIKRS
jgi:hypothetical protein